MICDRFAKYEIGEIREKDFLQHLDSCASCRKEVEQDARLTDLTKSIKRPVTAPHLWDRIEKSLLAEARRGGKHLIFDLNQKTLTIVRIAALLVVAITIGFYLWPKPEIGETKLLDQSILKRVEKRETAYMDAIVELEQKVEPFLEQFDVELSLLYKDRLGTIDAQIERCREALAINPANAHIRRYMLAALKDKKETLLEILRS